MFKDVTKDKFGFTAIPGKEHDSKKKIIDFTMQKVNHEIIKL